MYQLILVIHVLVAIALIALVLMQTSKGATLGSAGGSGVSSTLFGSHGAGNFLFKLTAGLGITFYCTSILLSHLIAVEYDNKKEGLIPQEITLPDDNPQKSQNSKP